MIDAIVHGGQMNNRPAAFDSQAATYDRRAGLPEQHCQAIAQAVLRLSAAIPGDLLLEVGAGTGMIGTWLAQPPLRYIGVDLSRRMLAAFQRRLAVPSHMPVLLQADGNHPWPLADGAIGVIFSKLSLEEDGRDNRRVLAVLAYLDGRPADPA